MKWSQLARGTIDAGEGLRLRLARKGDERFLERMSEAAGVGQVAARVTRRDYQSGFRAALDYPHLGFYKTVQTAYNRTGRKRLAQGIEDAVSVGTYDLVATVKGKPVGALHMGAPGAVISSLWADEKIHEHLLVSLIISVTKLVASQSIPPTAVRGTVGRSSGSRDGAPIVPVRW